MYVDLEFVGASLSSFWCWKFDTYKFWKASYSMFISIAFSSDDVFSFEHHFTVYL